MRFHLTRGETRRGGAILETALFVPVMALLLFGMVEFARLGYTYFAVQKILYSLARFVGTSQAVNFCDDADPMVLAAKNYALTGATDASSPALIADLTADMIQVRVEKYNADTQELLQCACEITGCDAQQGAAGPDYIVVTIPNGYPVQLAIPFMPHLDPIPLRPQIRLPYGGT